MTTARRLVRAAVLVGAFLLGVALQASGLLGGILGYREDVVYLAQQHIVLTLVSGGLAIAVGVPLGVLLSRPALRRVAEPMMQVLNIGTTVPTLAILALSMSVLGIGTRPAIFALWFASLLPIVRNTYAGLRVVPRFLLEAATGMGMQPRQILWRVELPNAIFVIFAGIRTALVINVGTVPLAFLIGGGGLGELIFTGIDLFMPEMMLAGAIATAGLAVALDFVLGQMQVWLIPRGVNPLR